MATVTMTKTLRNAGGMLNAGTSYTLSDSLALELVGRGAATLTGGDRTRLLGIAQPGRTVMAGHAGLGVINKAGAWTKGNLTFCETRDLPCAVDAVRIWVACEAADVSTYTGVRVYVQTTDASGGGANLQNPYLNSVAQTMQSCTFGGANSPTFVNGGSVDDPIYVPSDWTPVVDTGPALLPGLIIRQWYPNGVAAGTGYAENGLYGGRSAVVNAQGGKSFFGANNSGSNVGASNATTFITWGGSVPVFVELAAKQNIACILLAADSTGAGWALDGAVSSVERYARARSLAGQPTSILNLAVPGQTTEQFFKRLERQADSGRQCDTLMYQVASPNDDIGAQTAATSAAQIARAHRVVALGAKMGAKKIVFKGPLPMASGTPSAGTLTCINNARQFCISMSEINPNVSCVLYDELHDSAQYGKWVAAYTPDGLHPNELAGQVMLRNETAVLNAALA